MECYFTCIIEILSYFFILQSLTTSKMRKFQTIKLSKFHKANTCWTENFWPSGIMSNFWGQFFMFWGQKIHLKFFENIVASALKSCIKWSLKKIQFSFSEFYHEFWIAITTLQTSLLQYSITYTQLYMGLFFACVWPYWPLSFSFFLFCLHRWCPGDTS